VDKRLDPRRFAVRTVVGLFLAAVVIFIVAPTLLVAGMSLNDGAFFSFPPRGISLRWYTEGLFARGWLDALTLSLVLGIASASIACIIGVAAAIGLFEGSFRGKAFASAILHSPILVPQLLLGIALAFVLSRLAWSGTPASLLAGHVLVTTPFVLRLVLGALPGVPVNLVPAARTLGASPGRALIKVLLPVIRPAIVSGWIFAFVISFDNVMISLFLTSPRVSTLPVRILSTMDQTADPTIAAISTVFMLVAIGMMLILNRFVGLQFESVRAATATRT
jgi:putative spermidine/putrescine transport system permease protein